MKNKISVLMTVYNAEKFLKESINSIKNQTYKNWELIIIDDFSSDKSLSKIKELKNKKIKLYSLKKHIGRTSALNYGLKKVSGDFIAIHDADDIAHKERLKIEIEFLKKNKKVYLVGSWYRVINSEGKFIEYVKTNTEEKKIYENMVVNNVFCHTSVMFKSEILKKIGKYPENLVYSQDYGFILKTMRVRIPRIIPKYLTTSRRHRKSMTYNPVLKKFIIKDKIKILLYSSKNFNFTFKSRFFWFLRFSKAFFDLTLTNILFLNKNK